MIFKRNDISSLLLELDSDDIPQSRRGVINNALAQEVVELTNIPDCAKNLIEYEKGIIELRGNDKSNYLMNDSLSVRDVMNYFYKNIYYENDDSKHLTSNLSISELMIMLGVFSIISDSRKKMQVHYEISLDKIQRKNGKKFSCYLRKKNGIDEFNDNVYREEALDNDLNEECFFIEILDENIEVLKNMICSILDFKTKQITDKDITKIIKCSKELARSYTRIDNEYKRRKKAIPALFIDVLLLEQSGESPEVLEALYTSNCPPKQKKKIFSNES